ncbi:TfoX/Sxy family protein [Photobacterium lutimaris]|uniref:DNA transformation protein n=1 Tax=Photobacterium lutimaris TaxID=388278 RepID=A0A2T3ITK4_9GAMM|nr:TfoX/Sxy family protein [Photobacterium lutimaris]PSU31695.1 hypothetical protein C9I99_21140 [Photobacterium lutimaris]TDR72668.1 regulator of competence-specific genes [Photobacterium lutimaris]
MNINLKAAQDLFSPLGKAITVKCMFGGYGVFADGHIFAILVKDDIYLRASNSKLSEYKEKGFNCYTYSKPNRLHKSLSKLGGKGIEANHDVATRYYKVPYTGAELLKEAGLLLESAIIEKMPTPICEQRLKDLVNLKLSSERMLKRSGIDNYSKLKEVGAVSAFFAVKDKVNTELNHDFVLRLQGAIDNVHYSTLPVEVKTTLMNRVNID